MNERDVTAQQLDDPMRQFLSDAEHAVERAEWDVHCYEVAVEQCERELARQQAKLSASRERATAARAVHAALVEKFDV